MVLLLVPRQTSNQADPYAREMPWKSRTTTSQPRRHPRVPMMNQMTETEVSPSISKPLKVKDQKIMTKAVIPPITMLEVAEVCILLCNYAFQKKNREID